MQTIAIIIAIAPSIVPALEFSIFFFLSVSWENPKGQSRGGFSITMDNRRVKGLALTRKPLIVKTVNLNLSIL